MVNVRDYVSEWEKDAPIADDALDAEARKVPNLHAKWWKYYSTERLKYRMLTFEYQVLYKQKLEYYSNKMLDEDRIHLGWPINPRLILSGHIHAYIEADPHIQDLQIKRAYNEEVLKFLEDVIKSINGRGYLISTTVNYLKFKMGV